MLVPSCARSKREAQDAVRALCPEAVGKLELGTVGRTLELRRRAVESHLLPPAEAVKLDEADVIDPDQRRQAYHERRRLTGLLAVAPAVVSIAALLLGAVVGVSGVSVRALDGPRLADGGRDREIGIEFEEGRALYVEGSVTAGHLPAVAVFAGEGREGVDGCAGFARVVGGADLVVVRRPEREARGVTRIGAGGYERRRRVRTEVYIVARRAGARVPGERHRPRHVARATGRGGVGDGGGRTIGYGQQTRAEFGRPLRATDVAETNRLIAQALRTAAVDAPLRPVDEGVSSRLAPEVDVDVEVVEQWHAGGHVRDLNLEEAVFSMHLPHVNFYPFTAQLSEAYLGEVFGASTCVFLGIHHLEDVTPGGEGDDGHSGVLTTLRLVLEEVAEATRPDESFVEPELPAVVAGITVGMLELRVRAALGAALDLDPDAVLYQASVAVLGDVAHEGEHVAIELLVCDLEDV